MRKILVTGSSGFVGSEVIRNLNKYKEYQIFALDHKSFPLENEEHSIEYFEKVDAVVHLAGKTRGLTHDLMKLNLLGTVSLLETIRKLKGKKPLVIFPSTIGVYRPSVSITEKSIVEPKNAYCLSKLLVEETLRTYAVNFEIPIVILRIANIYGPTMPAFSHSVVSTFIELAKDGKELRIHGNGNQKRDFVYIGDLVKAIERSIKAEVSVGEVMTVNICSACGVSLNKLVKIISELVGNRVKVIYDKDEVEDYSWVGKNYDKAKKLLGWQPTISLEEGVRLIYEKKA